MKKRSFIVFINPISGTKSKGFLAALIKTELAKNNFIFEILPTEKSGKYEFLKQKIENENITDIIICGGDGSVNQIASHTLGTVVNIGIIPMGSGNGLAFCAGIPKNPKKALDIIIAGNASFIDAFWVNKQFSCHLIGLGFDAQVAHSFANQPKRGPTTYIKEVVKNYFKAKPFSFQINIDGHTINTEAFFVCIANSNQFGNKIVIAPKASLSDGLLDIVIVNKTNKFNVLLKIIKQLFTGKVVGIDNKKRIVQYYHTKKLSVSNLSMAPLHIDGEPEKTKKFFEINIIEKAFLLLQP
ncbi:MAG: YegS/Rv2252/BmrU family lipid kinase [Ferruginibacter sp.]